MNLASRITLLRLILVPFFMGCLLYWTPERPFLRWAAAAAFTAACLTDAADGIVARYMRQTTRLGSFIDPLADKALLLAAYFGLAFLSNLPAGARAPVWLALIVISRDLLILAGVSLIYALQKDFDPRTNFLGKCTTAAQMFFIFLVLWGAAPFKDALAAGVGVLTCVSGALYLRTGVRMLTAAEAAA